MLITQNYTDLGRPKSLVIVGPYWDEVELTGGRGYGLGAKEHVQKLNEQSGDLVVINCQFKICSGSSHPSYRTIRVSVVGDLCEGKLSE